MPEKTIAQSTIAAKSKFPFFPDNEEYWFETLRAFGSCSYGAADFGEVMSTVTRIPSDDVEAWYSEWIRCASSSQEKAAAATLLLPSA
jgi:hypothetical protein